MEIDTPILSDTTISKSNNNRTNTGIDFEDNENILNSPLFNAKSRKSLSLGNLNLQQNLQRRPPLQESCNINSLPANSNYTRNIINSIDTVNDGIIRGESNILSKSESQPQLLPNKSRDHLTHQRSNSLKRPLNLSPKVNSPNCIGLAADFYSNFHVNHSYKDVSNPKKILLTSIINNNSANHSNITNTSSHHNLNNQHSSNANDYQDSHDDNITSNDEESEDSDNDSQKTSQPQHSIFTNNDFSSTTLSLFPTSVSQTLNFNSLAPSFEFPQRPPIKPTRSVRSKNNLRKSVSNMSFRSNSITSSLHHSRSSSVSSVSSSPYHSRSSSMSSGYFSQFSQASNSTTNTTCSSLTGQSLFSFSNQLTTSFSNAYNNNNINNSSNNTIFSSGGNESRLELKHKSSSLLLRSRFSIDELASKPNNSALFNKQLAGYHSRRNSIIRLQQQQKFQSQLPQQNSKESELQIPLTPNSQFRTLDLDSLAVPSPTNTPTISRRNSTLEFVIKNDDEMEYTPETIAALSEDSRSRMNSFGRSGENQPNSSDHYATSSISSTSNRNKTQSLLHKFSSISPLDPDSAAECSTTSSSDDSEIDIDDAHFYEIGEMDDYSDVDSESTRLNDKCINLEDMVGSISEQEEADNSDDDDMNAYGSPLQQRSVSKKRDEVSTKIRSGLQRAQSMIQSANELSAFSNSGAIDKKIGSAMKFPYQSSPEIKINSGNAFGSKMGLACGFVPSSSSISNSIGSSSSKSIFDDSSSSTGRLKLMRSSTTIGFPQPVESEMEQIGPVQNSACTETSMTGNSQLSSAPIRTTKSNSCSLPSIDVDQFYEILRSFMNPNSSANIFNAYFDEVVVIDCRFEYEFEGGHIDNAVNICSKKELEKNMFHDEIIQQDPVSYTSKNRKLIVFHCEFSSHRGPRMANSLRAWDRSLNKDNYPNLHYPDIVILEGGYKKFFEKYGESHCFPKRYIAMDHPGFKEVRDREMDKFKRDSDIKLTRKSSFQRSFTSNSFFVSKSFHAKHHSFTFGATKNESISSRGLTNSSSETVSSTSSALSETSSLSTTTTSSDTSISSFGSSLFASDDSHSSGKKINLDSFCTGSPVFGRTLNFGASTLTSISNNKINLIKTDLDAGSEEIESPISTDESGDICGESKPLPNSNDSVFKIPLPRIRNLHSRSKTITSFSTVGNSDSFKMKNNLFQQRRDNEKDVDTSLLKLRVNSTGSSP
ncbi:hypothetical protein B5S33_g4325 [[Candida] boidinii]|nr:hypothetical protein B5S30_g2413 [[Candida] boidinii]OWB85656.1 hypothetical protein B5S33_g4325 [[Candida] boidinii]